MSTEDHSRVVSSDHSMSRYPCGLEAGDRLRLRRALRLQNHLGQPIGETIGTGSIWRVLAGHPDEPEVVWFEDPRGELHTWDAESIWTDFEAVQVE